MPEGRAKRLRRLRFAATLSGLVLCAVCAVLAFAEYASAAAWVDHTLKVERADSDWVADVLNADTAARGYLLSPRPDLLATFEASALAQARDADELRRLTAQDGVTPSDMDRCARDAAEVIATMRKTVGAMAAGRPPEAIGEFDTGEERRELAAFRADTTGIESEEDHLLGQRVAQQHRHEAFSFVGFGLFGVLTTLLALQTWRAGREAETSTDLAEGQRALADERAEAMRFQDTFVAILGHDLRSPLNAITMGIELIERRSGAMPDMAGPVQRVKSASLRMQRMIEQILDFARARVGGGVPISLKELDLAKLVEQIAAESRLSHAGRVFEVTVEGDARCRGDADRVEQVVSNLLGNAAAHGAEGPVTVAVRGETERVRLSVANGGEIPPELRERIFDPFRRGNAGQETRSPHTEGLGLGLFIAKHVVEQHGGTLDFASEAGTTTFTMSLPRRPSVPPRAG